MEQFKDRIRQRACRTLVERSQNLGIRSLDRRLACQKEQRQMGKTLQNTAWLKKVSFACKTTVYSRFFPQYQKLKNFPVKTKEVTLFNGTDLKRMGSLRYGKMVCKSWSVDLRKAVLIKNTDIWLHAITMTIST